MNRDERRGARGVDRNARALQPEQIGKPAGGNAGRASGREIRVDLARIVACVDLEVVGVAKAEEHARSRALQTIRRVARALERLPCHFQHQALLRVHVHRFARRDAEEVRIERCEVGEESAPARGDLAGRIGIRVVERVHVPAIRRRLADGIGAGGEQVPVRLGRGRIAGEAAGHADDRNRLHRGRGEPLYFLLQLEREQRELLRVELLETFEEFA